MSERYGNFAEGMSRDEINERIGNLNTRITQLENDAVELRNLFDSEELSQQDYERLSEVLDQQLSIAKYRRDGYLEQL